MRYQPHVNKIFSDQGTKIYNICYGKNNSGTSTTKNAVMGVQKSTAHLSPKADLLFGIL